MKHLLLFFSLSIYTFLPAQHYTEMMEDYSINFYEVCRQADEYFKTIDVHAKGSGYKQFQRWKDNYEYLYFPSGDRMAVDLHSVDQAMDAYKRTNENQFDRNGRSRRASSVWREVGPNEVTQITGHYAAGIGRVEDFYVVRNNANKIYLSSSSGGLYKTVDGGKNWSACATDFLAATGVNALSVNPYNSEHVFLNVRNAKNGTSYGIYESTDGGTTIKPTNFVYTNLGFGGLGSNFQVYDVECHPVIRNMVFVATSNGIYKSTDRLATWTRVSTSNRTRNIHFHPTKNQVIYTDALSSEKVLISTNTGNSFGASGTLAGNGNTQGFISVSPQAPRNVYFGSDKGVWVSRNEGATFARLSSESLGNLAFAVSSVDTNKMVIAGIDSYSSTNHGSSFFQSTFWSLRDQAHGASSLAEAYQKSTKYVHADIRKLASVNGVMYSATDGTLCKSTDEGTTWKDIMRKGVGIRENYKLGASQSEADVVILGSQDNGTTIRSNGQWIEAYGADGMEGFVHPLNPQWMIASIQNGGRLRTENASQTWEEANQDNSDDAPKGEWQAPILFDPLDHMTLFDFKDNVWKSTDFGKTHTYVGKASSFTDKISIAEIAHNNTKIMAIASGASLEKSTNGGASFSNITGTLPNSMIQDIAFDPNNDQVMAVVYASYQNNNQKVYLSSNGGSTWQNITHNIGNIPVHTIVIDHTPQSNLYIGTETGVYVKPMAANSWSSYSADLPNTTVEELEIVWATNTLKAATWGRGLWEIDLKDRATFPKIVQTTISNPPTQSAPGAGISQFVTAQIEYSGALSSVYLKASVNGIALNRTITMTHQGGNTWKSNQALPSTNLGDKVYFKVYALGAANDLTESFRFMYTIRPFAYCTPVINQTGADFITNVKLETLNNTSINNAYTHYQNFPAVELIEGQSYRLSLTLNAVFAADQPAAWIDYNLDGTFSASEALVMAPYNSNKTSIGNFTVPRGTRTGEVLRLRVRNYWSTNSPDPCNAAAGEVEDYPLIVQAVVGLELENEHSALELFPNPATDRITIVSKSNEPIGEVIIYDLTGRILKVEHFFGTTAELSTADLPASIYTVSVHLKGRVENRKLRIE